MGTTIICVCGIGDIMSKIIYVDNVILTPALMDKYWGNNANDGHTHDGLNQDGSVQKIRPGTDLDPNTLVPNTNLIDSQTLLLNASFDGGATFSPTVITTFISRVGNSVAIRFTDNVTGTMVGNVSIHLRIEGGGTWDTTFFGTQPWKSTTNGVDEGATSLTGHLRFIDNASNLRLQPISSTFADTTISGVTFQPIFTWLALL